MVVVVFRFEILQSDKCMNVCTCVCRRFIVVVPHSLAVPIYE